MKIEKRSENCYRVRKTVNKKTITATFDHKPTETEIIMAFSDKLDVMKEYKNIPFEVAVRQYCEMKKNVLSPRTHKEYLDSIKRFSDCFRSISIYDMTQNDIQIEINKMAADKSPKTVRNYHALISAVLGTYRPEMKIYTTLPQKVKKQPYIPTDEEVKKLVEYSKTHRHGNYYVPIVLACYSLRRSEICALLPSDLSDDNVISINKAKVLDHDKKWVIKTTKTVESTREIPIPEDVANQIREQGYVFNGYPNDITDFIDYACKQLKIPHFSIHKLRHYFATKLSSENIDSETIKKLGGWTSDFVFQNYRHPVDDKVKEATSKLKDVIF